MLLFAVILTSLTGIYGQQALDGSGECGLSGLSANPIEARIVGGSLAKRGDVPWQVRITYKGMICGGSILTSNWILTAAHCTFLVTDTGQVTPMITEEVSVFVGVLSVFERNDPREIDSIVRHPNYTAGANLDYDFALIHLKRPLEWSSNIRPICLPSNCSDDVAPGTNCMISGWGRSNYADTIAENNLKFAKIQIKSAESCQASMASKPEPEVNTLQITSRMICAGVDDGHVDACSGDSGGPLSCVNSKMGRRHALSGIISFGYKCAQPGYYGVYSRPCAVAPWIRNVVLPGSSRVPSPDSAGSAALATAAGLARSAVSVVSSASSVVRLDIINSSASINVCAGTFVSSQWVLTAGSCFSTQSSTVIVYVGETAAVERQYNISDIRIVFHPNYDPFFLDYNVALVKLEVAENRVLPINLSGAACDNGTAMISGCMIMGTGSISRAGVSQLSSFAEVQKATVSALTDAKCRSILQEDDFGYTDAKRCFGNIIGQQASDECRAVDIGSPVLCKDTSNNRYTLQGVMSYALAGSCNTTMHSYLVSTCECLIADWIQETISN